jgi:co-chaperonin GroES (HSP10)
MTALSAMKSVKQSTLSQSGESDAKLSAAFPDVDPGERPLGSLVLLQVKQAMTKTDGGIVLTKNDIETEFDNTQVAKVIAVAVGAFRDRVTLQPWPEGAWVVVGDYVRISQHNGKRWTKPIPGTRGSSIEDRVTFVLIDDLHIASVIDDPLTVKAFF